MSLEVDPGKGNTLVEPVRERVDQCRFATAASALEYQDRMTQTARRTAMRFAFH